MDHKRKPRRSDFEAALRKARRRANKQQKEGIDKVLARKDAAARDTYDSVYGGEVADYENAIQAGGPLTDFFDWLMEHIDDIIALILKLLPLFI
jgi:hypothetical protein